MINLWIKNYDQDIHALVCKYLEQNGWEYIGVGSFRMAYRRGNVVIKVPRNSEGFEDNVTEAYAYRKYRNKPDPDGRYFAPCRLLPSGCLMMPFVKRTDWGNLPTWAQRLDGGQAGRFKDRIVGYDTGYDIKHENRDAFKWAQVT